MKCIFLRRFDFRLPAVFVLTVLFAISGSGQGFDKFERARMKDILKSLKNEIKKTYYDPNFHGIDIDARFKKTEDRLDQVTTTGQALGAIAQTLIDFDDSHLYFIPPSTNLIVQYGWKVGAIGDKCFITSVKPKSDPEIKGVKVGDQVIAIEGFRPSKSELWKVQYYYNLLNIREKVKLTLLAPGASEPRDVEVKSEVKVQPARVSFQSYFRLFDNFYNEENDKHRFLDIDKVGVWKFPSFEIDPADVPGIMSRFKEDRGLIIDLRGNGGGYVKALEELVGCIFDKDIKIADLVGRKKMDPSSAKTVGKQSYKGKIIVLIDSNSASASEIFARLIQLEKRGQVLGDVSAGAVMQAVGFDGSIGMDSVVSFGASITNADVIMSDGKSIEHVGVIPDELILPTGDDLLARRDPVLSRALELLGVKLSPADAGKEFPGYFWK